MKRHILPPVLALLLVLASCTGGTAPLSEKPAEPGVPLTAAAAVQAVLDSQEGSEDLVFLPSDDQESFLTFLYGLTQEPQDAAIARAGGTDAREVAVLRFSDPRQAEEAARGLEDYRMARVSDFFGYLPTQAGIVQDAPVVTSGQWAALLICADPAAAQAALSDYLSGSLAPLPPSPQPSVLPSQEPSPALQPSEEPVPAPSEEPSDPPAPAPAEAPAEPSQTPTPADAPAPAPTPLPEGYHVFRQPGKGDLSLYDTAPILLAWETGDQSQLSEEDAAILARCREAMAVIEPGMTQFQRELALYRWVLDNVPGDPAAFDPRTPFGLPGSTTPYGALILGRAVCLGYATTFKLLMDMAEVECLVIVGAADRSRADHAWNMVKLEGEWYCLDITWNAPNGDSAKDPYRYFNVTSDYMAQTDHQWDYGNTPQATAARFRWDGKGAPPQ